MPNFFLVKSEPYVFSFADLQRDGRAMWDGVRSFEARNNLRAMRKGDLLLFYHSNEGKEVVGVAKVVATAYADPTAAIDQGGDGGDWSVVDVVPVVPLKKTVSLDDIRGEPRLRDINLLRRNRLSVVPVTAAEFALILTMGETKLPASAKHVTGGKEKAVSASKPLRATKAARLALTLALAFFGLLTAIANNLHLAMAQAPQKSADAKLDASPLLDARLVDLEDRVAPLRSYYEKPGAKVLVVLHQDRKSADENGAFKTELGRLAAKNPQALRVVALADVDGYDFWPAKGYVKDALRPLKNDGATVVCDWRGSVRKQYGLRAGHSAVFVISPAGELQALSRGKLSADESKNLLRTISELLPADRPTP